MDINIEPSLTKENFWNSLRKEYPKSMKHFLQWIDEYKKAVNWNEIFREEIKFHDLPYAMQEGIWVAYLKDQGPYFGVYASEYSGVNLKDDIHMVFPGCLEHHL